MTLPVLRRSHDLTAWDPFRELDALARHVNSLWESGFGDVDGWSPRADVEETDDAYSVEVELPGVRREDIDVELDGGLLTVSGEVEEKERTGILRRRTRRVGLFRYTVTLPGEVDADEVSARLRDGVLTVRVPKSGTAQRRRIPVSS
jgi:HSP20 family protein